MKKILTILLTVVSLSVLCQEPIGHQVDYYDTVRFRQPFILQNGDTCEIFVMNNDSIVMVCNSLDTVRIDGGGGSVDLSDYYTKSETDQIVGDSTGHAIDSANAYTDAEKTYYTVTYYYQLPTSNVVTGSKGYVSFEEKEYIFNGVSWELLISNKIEIGDKTIERIYDYRSDLKAIDNFGYIGFDGVPYLMYANSLLEREELYITIINDGILESSGINNLGSNDLWLLRFNNFTVDSFLRIGSVDNDYEGFTIVDDDENIRMYMDIGTTTATQAIVNGFYDDTVSLTNNTVDALYMKFDNDLNIMFQTPVAVVLELL